MEYFTTATTGNATDFGDLTTATRQPAKGLASNTTIGLFVSGYNSPNYYNTIEKITIASTSNAADFGDTIGARSEAGAASNGHGGLVGG